MGEHVTDTQRGSRDNWLLACGPGCAVLVIAALIAGVVAWRASTRSFEIKRAELREDMVRQFGELLANAQLTPEQTALIGQVQSESLRPEVGYFGMLLYVGGVLSPLQGATVKPEDEALARETAEYLKDHPAPTFWAYGDYVNARPALQQTIESFKTRHEAKPSS